MALKLFVLPSIAFLIALFTPIWFQQSEACSCGPSLIPLRCRADFVAIVLIRESYHPSHDFHWKAYGFRLLFLIYDRYFLAGYRRFRYLWTSEHSASCGVKLQIGKTYLIGVKYNYQRNRFELNLCSSLYRILHHWRHRKWHIYSRMRQCLRYDAFKEYLKPKELFNDTKVELME